MTPLVAALSTAAQPLLYSTMALTPLDRDWAPLLERANASLEHELARELRDASVTLPVLRIELLSEFLDHVVTWNRKIDLTAARSHEELVDLYLADAIVVAANARTSQWVDVGSGGGAPGVTLTLLRPELALTLVEPRAKRVAFLRNVLALLEIDTPRVVRARSDQLESASFDTAISRATLAPADWLVEGTRLARREVWVLLAQGEPPCRAGWVIDCDISYRWPLTGVSRRAVRYVKVPPP